MKKLLFKGFLLVLTAYISCLFVAGFDNAHKLNDDNVLRVYAASESKALELLFVGPSYVYSGIMPSLFDSAGIKTCNIAVSTAGAFYTKELVDNFLRSSTVSTICLSLSYTTFSDLASDKWSLYPIHRYLTPAQSNEMIYIKYGNTEEYIQMLRSSVRKGIKNICRKSELDRDALNRVMETGGFATSSGTVTTDMVNKDKALYEDYKKSVFSEEKVRAFLETIEVCRKKGVQVVLIEPPTYLLKVYFETEYLKKYEQLKNKLKKTTKIIECDSTWETNSLFRNTDHLNVSGAKKYTAYLIRQFKQQL